MKKLLFTLILPFTVTSLFAQTYCGTPRYDTEMFPNVTKTSDIVYGSNINYSGGTTSLKMDIYQPTGDVATKRPLIVFAHGGSFIGGSKTDADQVALCTRFAKRGYVAVTIDYRLGMGFPINKANALRAVWRATQDMKAAVRFFRKDAATTNTYKVDPNYIFVGGYSAGAFMAIHYAYLDKSSEVPTEIDTVALGGLEGNSGNPGYPSGINGVINLAGSIGDTLWMKAGDKPMVTAQGNNDATVPYCHATISVSGFPIMPVDGGGTMHIRCFNLGIDNPIHTFYGQGHSADVSPSTNLDTVVGLVSNFVYKNLGCTPSGSTTYINNQTCVPGVTGINNPTIISEANVSLYPNPAIENIQIQIAGVSGSKFSGEIRDITGRKMQEFQTSDSGFQVERKNLQSGIYFLKLTSDQNEVFVTKIIFTE